jgi:WD40 repeat protein
MKRHMVMLILASFAFASFAWAQSPTEFKGHTGLVSSVSFDKDGKVLATGGYDGAVKLWDATSGKVLHTIKASDKQIYAVAFSPDGSVVASAGTDNLIKLWNPKDAKAIKEMKGHTGIVSSLAYSPDGAVLASGSNDKSVRLWDPKAAKEIKNLGSHKEAVYSVAFSANGKYLVSGSFDGAIKVWDIKDQKEVKQFLAPTLKIEFKEEKKKEEKKEEKKKEAKKDDKKGDKKGMAKKKEEPKEIRENVTQVAFTPDNKYVLSVGFDRLLRVWDIADGKQVKELLCSGKDDKGKDEGSWINGLAISRDGKLVATAGYGGALRVFEIGSWKEVFRTRLPKSIVYCVAFTPDSKALVTGHENPNYTVKVTPIIQKK